MLLNKHIGFITDEGGMGIDGSVFQEELLALDQMGKKPNTDMDQQRRRSSYGWL